MDRMLTLKRSVRIMSATRSAGTERPSRISVRTSCKTDFFSKRSKTDLTGAE